MKKITKGKTAFDFINYLLVIIISLIIIVPVLNILAASFSSGKALSEGNFIIFPSEFSLQNFKVVFSDQSIWRSFIISILKTTIGVTTHVLFCAMFAYGISKQHLIGRKIYVTMGVITMFFSGGMVPIYLLFRQLGLLNSFMVYILPQLFSYYDIIILMNFFKQVPPSMEESAKIDGASTWTILLKIILPLSKPALATIALFNGVFQWNDFMTAKLYITNKNLYPVQMKLYEIIVQQSTKNMGVGTVIMDTTSKGVQLATIVVATLPILIAYPLLQKHFVSGIMAGAVKE